MTKEKQILLEAVRRYEENEVGWVQGTWAKDKEGKTVDECSPEACNFCLSGIIRRISYDASIELGDQIFSELEKTAKNIAGMRYIHYNDYPTRTKEEVIHLLKTAADMV